MENDTHWSVFPPAHADSGRGEKTRSRIIKAAADLFAKKGLNSATMSDVAALAGVGKGTIYAHFKSKEDLFFTVMDHVVQEALESARIQVTDIAGSPARRLWAVNQSVVAGIRRMLPYYGLVLEFWSAASQPSMRDRIKTMFRTFYGHLPPGGGRAH